MAARSISRPSDTLRERGVSRARCSLLPLPPPSPRPCTSSSVPSSPPRQLSILNSPLNNHIEMMTNSAMLDRRRAHRRRLIEII